MYGVMQKKLVLDQDYIKRLYNITADYVAILNDPRICRIHESFSQSSTTLTKSERELGKDCIAITATHCVQNITGRCTDFIV